jgi:hypothetical protein
MTESANVIPGRPKPPHERRATGSPPRRRYRCYEGDPSNLWAPTWVAAHVGS